MQDEFQIKEYRESIQLLDDLRARVESGEIMTILAVAEMTDGSMAGWYTSTLNVFAMCGYIMSVAMIRMGFVQDEKLKRNHDGS